MQVFAISSSGLISGFFSSISSHNTVFELYSATLSAWTALLCARPLSWAVGAARASSSPAPFLEVHQKTLNIEPLLFFTFLILGTAWWVDLVQPKKGFKIRWIKPGDYPFLYSAAAVPGCKGNKNIKQFITFVPSISCLARRLRSNIWAPSLSPYHKSQTQCCRIILCKISMTETFIY